MHTITMMSVGSTQGEFFLQDFKNRQDNNFFREKEILNKRMLSNKLLHSDILCFTLKVDDTICDVVDYCSMILKVLPNTSISEILLNDSLVNDHSGKIDCYISEVMDLLTTSGLPINKTSCIRSQSAESVIVNYKTIKNIEAYLSEIFSFRILSKSFLKSNLFSNKNRVSNNRKLSRN